MSYIPASDAAFNAWLLNFSALLTADPTDFGLTAGDATVVAGVTSTWSAAYAAAIAPSTRTSVTVAAKDAAKQSALATVRPYAVSISINPAVIPDDKIAIGVTLRTTTPTPIPAPTVAPEIGLSKAIIGQTTLTYKTPDSSGKYKPYGVIGVQIWTKIGEAHTTDPAECQWHQQATKTPFQLSTSPADSGKPITIFGRYVTRSGPGGESQVGPWSAPLQLHLA